MPENNINPVDKAMLIAAAAIDKKAEQPVILEVKEHSDVADYFVICSASSDRGVKTVADNIEKVLKENKIKIMNIEGAQLRKWILIDTYDVVTHIFYEPLREFYDLEGLYIDSPRINNEFTSLSTTGK